MGNKYGVESILLDIPGRTCSNGGLVTSQHDRRFIWSGDQYLLDDVWGKHGACISDQPDDSSLVDCSDRDTEGMAKFQYFLHISVNTFEVLYLKPHPKYILYYLTKSIYWNALVHVMELAEQIRTVTVDQRHANAKLVSFYVFILVIFWHTEGISNKLHT